MKYVYTQNISKLFNVKTTQFRFVKGAIYPGPAVAEIDENTFVDYLKRGCVEISQEQYKAAIESGDVPQLKRSLDNVRPLGVALAYYSGDWQLALKLLRWIKDLSGKINAHCALISSPSCSADSDKAILAAAQEAFASAILLKDNKNDDAGWPGACNIRFKTAATYYRNNGIPWLWLEPDCVPITPNWFDALQKEYFAYGKPYMGAMQNNFLAGVAIYPPYALDHFAKFLDSNNDPWDRSGGAQVLREAHITRLIQHEWGKPNEPPTFTSLSSIKKEAVLFHRCKDGSLIDLLASRVGKMSAVQSPVQRNVCDAAKTVSIVQLGRIGDIINILPLAWYFFRNQKRVKLIVHRTMAHVLDRVTYVEPVIWDGDIDDPDGAKSLAEGVVLVPQLFSKNGLRKAGTGSWQSDQYKFCGYLDRFNRYAPDFDKRDFDEELRLWQRVSEYKRSPIIACNFKSYSSPFVSGIAEKMKNDYPDLIDLSELHVEHYTDLLGVLDRCDLVVTVDTSTLHLLQASHVPYIAILNDKWGGSIPRRKPVATMRYSEFKYEKLKTCIKKALQSKKWEPESVVHVVMMRQTSDYRLIRARSSWDEIYVSGVVPLHIWKWPRVFMGRPYLRDALYAAADLKGDNAIVFTNDDVIITQHTIDYCLMRLKYYPIVLGARTDLPEKRGERHIGRDLLAVRSSWLRDNMEKIPDFLIGGPFWDFALLYFTRKLNDIKCEDVAALFPECDLPLGLVMHDFHPSAWAGSDALPLHKQNQTFCKLLMSECGFNPDIIDGDTAKL